MSLDISAELPVQVAIVYEHGQAIEITTNDPDIEHFLKYVRVKSSYNTWLNYACDLKVFFSVVRKRPGDITRADCLDFMIQQEEAGLKDTTINRRLATISSLFNELTLLDPPRFPRNPIQPGPRRRRYHRRSKSLYKRQPQRVPKVIPDEDIRALLAALRSYRDRAIVMLMWRCCLRVSEVVNIGFQDIECSHRRIWISAAKYGNVRNVYMPEDAFAALNQYLDNERGTLFPKVEHIFVAFKGKARGRTLSVNAVQKMINYYAEKCGLDHVHAHAFRHTGITQLVEARMEEPAIRKLVGHRSPESLEPYLHLCDEFVEEEFRQAQVALDPSRRIDIPR